MNEPFFRAAVELAQVLKNWAETVHHGTELAQSMRGVLDHLQQEGPESVPQIARARRVSRQHVQQLVDSLEARQLVRRVRNPAHRRSPLFSVTDRGRAAIEGMRAEERNALSKLRAGTSDHAVEEATQVISAWTEVLLEDAVRRRSGLDGSS